MMLMVRSGHKREEYRAPRRGRLLDDDGAGRAPDQLLGQSEGLARRQGRLVPADRSTRSSSTTTDPIGINYLSSTTDR